MRHSNLPLPTVLINMTTITLFTRQRSSSFNHTSRELVWASEGTYAHVSEYGNHMYQLEVTLVGAPMEYLESQDSVPAGYTYGVRGANGAWYCFSSSLITSCTYMGELGEVDYTSPEDRLLMFQNGVTPLFKLKKLEQGKYQFRLDGTVLIDLINKIITPPEDWDEDEWDDNGKLIKYLSKYLFT